MKRIVIYIFIVMVAASASAQIPYRSVVEWVESHSPVFEALHSQQDADKVAAYSGSLFDDPEVEFGYYWGSPSEIGNRWDLSVMQSFELPSVISHRNHIRSLLSQEADMNFRLRRAELLKEVMTTCNDVIYYRQCVAFYSRCVSRSQQLSEVYKRRMDAGDCSILDYNRVMMDLADLQNKLNMAQVDADMSMDNLSVLNGGKPVDFTQDTFDVVVLPADIQKFIDSCLSQSASASQYSLKFEKSVAEQALAMSSCLPKFQAGYKSENVVGETFRGVAVGMSIPLWSKKNTVKHATMQTIAERDEWSAYQMEQSNQLMAIYRKALSMQQTLQNLRDIYSQHDVEDLLLKAFNAGELSLENYLQQVEFYHESRMTIIETERELNALNVELQSANL